MINLQHRSLAIRSNRNPRNLEGGTVCAINESCLSMLESINLFEGLKHFARPKLRFHKFTYVIKMLMLIYVRITPWQQFQPESRPRRATDRDRPTPKPTEQLIRRLLLVVGSASKCFHRTTDSPTQSARERNGRERLLVAAWRLMGLSRWRRQKSDGVDKTWPRQLTRFPRRGDDRVFFSLFPSVDKFVSLRIIRREIGGKIALWKCCFRRKAIIPTLRMINSSLFSPLRVYGRRRVEDGDRVITRMVGGSLPTELTATDE